MQLVEIALFAAVAALALTLIGYAVRPYLRARRRPTAGEALSELPSAPRELAPTSPGCRWSLHRAPKQWSAPPATVTTPRGCGSAPTTRAIWFRPAIRRSGPRVRARLARPAGARTTRGRSSARSTARSWFRCRSRWGPVIRSSLSRAGWERSAPTARAGTRARPPSAAATAKSWSPSTDKFGTLKGSRAPRDELEPAKPSLPHAIYFGTLKGSRAPRDELEPAKPSLPHAIFGGVRHARAGAAPARLLPCVLASSTGVV